MTALATEMPVLSLANVHKRFGETNALHDATFAVRAGTVHALLGENGAGKTTLMRIAYGLVAPDAGDITLDGRPVRFGGVSDAIAAGIGMVHQHFTLVPVMSVAENVALGGHGRLDMARVTERVQLLGRRTGFALDPKARVASLSVGAQQRVEIAKALAREARILILDEPTAVLAPAEAAELLRWLREYADAGHAVVLITHKLREALSIADDVTVLRRGRSVHAASALDASEQSLTAAMMGDGALPASAAAVRETQVADATQPVVFHADRLTVANAEGATRLRDAAFSVRAGEIVGVAGVEGSGQRELLRALAGRLPALAGTLQRPPVVGFIPEDRHHDAVLLDRSLAENVALRGAGVRRGRIDWRAVRRATEAMMNAFDVRAPSAQTPMRALSGGNQQKLVLARELERTDAMARHAIVAENPTRGLDVRATAEVHARLREARAGGAAIVLYSSDIDEVLLLATRMLVVHAGMVRETPLDRDAVGRAMLGVL